jgi:predicted ATPase
MTTFQRNVNINSIVKKQQHFDQPSYASTTTASSSICGDTLVLDSSYSCVGNNGHKEYDNDIVVVTSGEVDQFESRIDMTTTSFRQTEVENIKEWYQVSRNDQGNAESILIISGPSGSGKTHLVYRSLDEYVAKSGGYFVSAKFDFLQHPEPFKALLLALNEFIYHIEIRGSDEIERIRNSIDQNLGDEIVNLSQVLPALQGFLIDKSKKTSRTETAPSKNEEAQRQDFISTFIKFVGAICSFEYPLVLLVDDVHWADSCSMELMLSLVKEIGSNNGFHLVCTNDSYAMGNIESPCCKMFESIKNGGSEILYWMNIAYPTQDELSTLVKENYFPNSDNVDEHHYLTKIIYERTTGDTSRISYIINWLKGSDLLVFDNVLQRWNIKCDTIDTVKQISDLQEEALESLSTQTRDVLQIAACLGFEFDSDLISVALSYPVDAYLVEATETGFIVYNSSKKLYSFASNQLHSTIYHQLPDESMEFFHLELGRILWGSMEQVDVDSHVFVILSQIRLGIKLVNQENDRHAIASFFLHAGKKVATTVSSFRIAATYLSLGVSLLDRHSWRSHYDLCLSIYNLAAEMEMSLTNHEVMNSLVDTILREARSTEHKVQAYSTRIYALGVLGKNDEAIKIGLDVLKALGETFPRDNIFRTGRMIMSVIQFNQQLEKKSDNDILNLSPMTDERKLACMRILNILLFSTMRVQPNLYPFIALRQLQLTLQYGSSVYSSMAFVGYGLVLSAAGCFDQAYRLGMLGLDYLQRYKAQEYLPRVYALCYICIYPWKMPLTDTIQPLLKGYKVGLQTGDIEFATLCLNLYLFHSEQCGAPLPQVVHQLNEFKHKLGSKEDNSLQEGFIAADVVLGVILGTLPASELKDEMLIKRGIREELFTKNEVTDCVVQIRISQMIGKYIVREYKDASRLADFVMKHFHVMSPIPYARTNATFVMGMNALQLVDKKFQRRKNRKVARKCIKTLKQYSVMCHENFGHFLKVLQGEYIAKTSKNVKKALDEYLCAIQLARQRGCLHIEGFANQCIVTLLVANGKISDARPYYQQACQLNDAWGGQTQAKLFKMDFQHIF